MSTNLMNTVYVVTEKTSADADEEMEQADNDSPNNNDHNKRQRTVGRVRWVKNDDDASGVSRSITGAALPDARVGFPVTLHAKYAPNVNTSLKACAIALPKCAIEHSKHAACLISFRENRNELSIKCSLLADPSAPCQDDTNTSSSNNNSSSNIENNKMSVSKKTDYKILAGAIANRIRNLPAGTLIRIAAVGPECVFIAARAVAVCSQYLEQGDPDSSSKGYDGEPRENDIKNLVCVPRFTKVQMEGRDDETNVLELCVFSADTVPDEE